MFCRKATISKTASGEERKIQRLYRISNSHQLNTFNSAGIHIAAERAADLSSALRLTQDLEDKRAPALLTQSKGFQLLMEHAIIAYVQTVVERASALQQNMQTKKRLCTSIPCPSPLLLYPFSPLSSPASHLQAFVRWISRPARLTSSCSRPAASRPASSVRSGPRR